MYLHRIHAVTFLSFRAYNTDNQLITDTQIVYDIAAMRSVSLRLQSLNQKTLTEYHDLSRSLLHGFVFDFLLILIVP